MTGRKPPRLAVWLLDRLGYTRSNSPLAGDLLEEFGSGRSSGWYWRQTLEVIANGARRNAADVRPYLIPYLAGALFQLPLVFALRRIDFPGQVHGWWRWLIGLLLLMTGVFAVLLAKRRIGGHSSEKLKRICIAGGHPGLRVVAAVALEGFQSNLSMYWLYAMAWNISPAELAGAEAFWICWDVAQNVLAVPAGRRTEEPAAPAEERPFRESKDYPAGALALWVSRPRGVVALRRGNVAESAAADPDLARALFGRGASIETVHRAIWLGCARKYGATCADPSTPRAVTLLELAALVKEAARTPEVERAVWIEPLSRWQRIRERFGRRAA